MTETIGNYNFSLYSKQFYIDYIRNKKYYFDLCLMICKIVLPILVGLYFNIFSNINSIFDFIAPSFIVVLVLIYLSSLYGLIIKPSKCFLKYDKNSHSFDVKMSHFTTKRIDLKKSDTIKVEKIKEKITYDISSARLYYYIINHCTENGVKTELFIINSSSIINKGEFDTIKELDTLTKKIMLKLNYYTGLKIVYADLVEK